MCFILVTFPFPWASFSGNFGNFLLLNAVIITVVFFSFLSACFGVAFACLFFLVLSVPVRKQFRLL